MQNNRIREVGEGRPSYLFSSSMFDMLNVDIQEVMSKYILENLVMKYQSGDLPKLFNLNQNGISLNEQCLLLNKLVLERRKGLLAPIPLYPNSDRSRLNSEWRDRTDSLTEIKWDVSPKTDEPKSYDLSPKKVVENTTAIKIDKQPKKKSKDKLKQIKINLAFDNEGDGLATRCDVVYKTILRDFRRFFLDEFKSFNDNQAEKHGMEDSLLKYIIQLFPNLSVNQCKTISLDLGCLLFHKEMAKDATIVKEMERRSHFGRGTSDIPDKIMRIHGFLYKFSIEKIEECFQNTSLSKLFMCYVRETGEVRIHSNITMSKNASVYLKARKILLKKASKREV